MTEQIPVVESKAKEDFVTLHNPSSWNFVDRTPRGTRFELKPGKKAVVPKSLAIWFIGSFDSPFYPLQAEIEAIYSRNRYPKAFLKIMRDSRGAVVIAGDDTEEAIEAKKEYYEDRLEDASAALEHLRQNPEKVEVEQVDTTVHDPQRVGDGFSE